MIDTHTHLNFPQLASQLEAVLKRAGEAGITDFIVPAVDGETSTSSVNLSELHPSIHACVGVHPTHTDQFKPEEEVKIKELLQGVNGVVAMGEIGLDYYHFENMETAAEKEAYKQRQGSLFVKMIRLAKEYQLPLIIHSREAFEDTLRILTKEASQYPTVIHCFSGTESQAKQWLDIGCYLSFTGMITYKKNGSLRDVIKKMPLSNLMIETDSPYLAPEGFRGAVCEPKFVRNVAECIAEIKGISLEEVAEVTTATSKKYFNFK